VGELRAWLKIHYPWVQALVPDGSDLDCGTPPAASLPPSSDELKCLTAVPKLANALLIGSEKVTGACLDGVRKGKIAGACPDEKGQDAIAKLEAKVTDGVAKACGTLPLWWDQCPESEFSCGSSPIGSLAALSACSSDSAQPIGDEITCGLYASAGVDGIACAPTVVPTATPTPTMSPTRTPTSTPTPTPTSTTSPACCQFAGGVCGGGDPDSCVPSSGTIVGGGAVCGTSGQCSTGPRIRGGCCRYGNPVSTCTMPIDEATCEGDGGVYDPDADYCSPSGSCVRTSHAFVTSTTYDGNFNGFNGALFTCWNRAAAAGLSGYYQPWISDGAFNPADDLGHPNHPIDRLDGRIVADNWADLTDGTLDASISLTEFGTPITGFAYVWTNTKKDGSVESVSTIQNCNNWTSASSGNQGLIGRATEATSYWTTGWGTSNCASTAHLYCIEQR
jgi:hypothetical protein